MKILHRGGFHALCADLHAAGCPRDVVADWLQVASDGLRAAAERYPDLPRFNLGYSLGALLALLTHSDPAGPGYRAAVFLAPALSLTPAAAAIRFLAPLAWLGLSLRSATPEELRSRPATPLAEYRAMLQLMAEASDPKHIDRARRLPTRVLLDPEDELVHFAGVEEWIHSRGLESWRLERIFCPREAPSHHLLISERYAGPEPWSAITHGTLDHLAAYCQ